MIFQKNLDISRYSRKIQSGIEDIFFLKNPGSFRFVTLPLENWGKTNLSKIVLRPLEIPRSKCKIQKEFFLITPRNSTITLGNSRKNKALLLEIL